jgi:predicted hydrocarbon binding protein/CheY-like chemotaxis protein
MNRDLAYVVHSDPVIAHRVSQALRDAEFEVASMTTLEDAEYVIRERQFDLPDAILTPLRDMESGDSILIRLLESNPLMEQIPLVVIANAGADERRRALRLGLLGVVAPPYDDEEVTLTTKLAIDKHRHDQALFGSMSQLSVADLLQTAEVGRRSGMVTFQHDNDKAKLWLDEGRVVGAEIQGGIEGTEAVYEIATWETGVFEADFGSVEIEPKFSMSPSELLLEAMRRLDERRAATKEDTDALTIQSDLAESSAELAAIRLGDTGEVTLEPRWEFEIPPEDLAGLVSTWIIRFFNQMDGALAWRFTKKRLVELFTPWHEGMQRLGFVGLTEPRPDDDEMADAEPDRRPRQPVVRGSLPEGCLLLDTEGKVESYAPFGLRVNHLDAETVVGRPFLGLLAEEVAAMAEVMLKSLARMPVDPLNGSLRDAGDGRIVVANEDFLDAFESVFTKHLGFRHHEFLRELGRKWGLRHAFRLEQHVQREYGKTLREMQTQMALELLSSSLGVLGLGRFDADLSRRNAGIIVIRHSDSPFPGHFVAVSGSACPILAGFHSAVLTYLSGRRLTAREFHCASDPGGRCVFIVATEERVSKLVIGVPGSPDRELVSEILADSGQGEAS